MSHSITGDLIIGSQRIAKDERPLRATNPDTGLMIEPAFAFASDADVNKAADLAWAAFDVFRQTSLEQRAKFLETIAQNILDIGPALIERAVAESGLATGRLEGERGRTVGQLRMFASFVRTGEWLDLRIDPAMPERAPMPRSDLRSRQVPLGPVAVFGASNFPLAFSVAGGDTASALAAGCPVIVKGHPAHPGTGELVGQAIQKAVADCGLPEGVFSLLLGGIETGTALVKHRHVKAVGFTGSRGGGLALVAAAAARPEPIPVYAEMSSINPVFLLPGALAARGDTIAAGFVQSLTLGSGQFCTNPGLIFAIKGPELDAFVEKASAAILGQVPVAMLTPGIHQAYDKGVQAFADHKDVTTVARGKLGEGPNRGPAALFMTEAENFLSDDTLSHEVFGAASMIITCASAEQLVDVTEKLEGQLTATLQLDSSDSAIAGKLLTVLERKVGRILANGWPTGVEVSHAMVHGGPFPATSDSRTTSVGTFAIRRFLRPVCYQDLPADLLPPELQPNSTLPRLLDGVHTAG